MKVRQTMFPAVLFGLLLIGAGCATNFNAYADLNGDGKPEIIFGYFGESEPWWAPPSYILAAKFSGGTAQTESRLIQRIRSRPEEIHFIDFDNDDDLDLVFSVRGGDWTVTYDTYVAKNNDGSGNFGNPELVNRRERKTVFQ